MGPSCLSVLSELRGEYQMPCIFWRWKLEAIVRDYHQCSDAVGPITEYTIPSTLLNVGVWKTHLDWHRPAGLAFESDYISVVDFCRLPIPGIHYHHRRCDIYRKDKYRPLGLSIPNWHLPPAPFVLRVLSGKCTELRSVTNLLRRLSNVVKPTTYSSGKKKVIESSAIHSVNQFHTDKSRLHVLLKVLITLKSLPYPTCGLDVPVKMTITCLSAEYYSNNKPPTGNFLSILAIKLYKFMSLHIHEQE